MNVEDYSFVGWYGILKEIDSLLLSCDPDYTILQIKEKFGSLRYYFKFSDSCSLNREQRNELHNKVRYIESRSVNMCEGCGCASSIHKRGEYSVSNKCDACYADCED